MAGQQTITLLVDQSINKNTPYMKMIWVCHNNSVYGNVTSAGNKNFITLCVLKHVRNERICHGLWDKDIWYVHGLSSSNLTV